MRINYDGNAQLFVGWDIQIGSLDDETRPTSSPQWMAPELITGEVEIRTVHSDIYAFAMTSLQVLFFHSCEGNR